MRVIDRMSWDTFMRVPRTRENKTEGTREERERLVNVTREISFRVIKERMFFVKYIYLVI